MAGWQDAPTVDQFAAAPAALPSSTAPALTDDSAPAQARASQTDSWQAAPTVDQFAKGAGPASSDINSDSAHGAGLIDTAVASLASDPNAQINYYAKQRGIPTSRYRVVDGNVVYVADDGKWYRELPAAHLDDPMSLAQRVASGVGPTIPAMAGTAGGILSMAGGPAASIKGAAAGGAAGEAVREGLAKVVMDQPISPLRIAAEGASSAAGQAVGTAMASTADRLIANEYAKLNQTVVAELNKKAALAGIDLTPAEQTNLSSLKAQQKYLGNMPGTSDKMTAFYENRNDQVKAAIQNFLDKISPVDSSEQAGEMAKDAATGQIGGMKTALKTQAAADYKAAFDSAAQVDVTPVIKSIDDELAGAKGPVKAALESARKMLFTDTDANVLVPDTSVKGLHGAKIAMDAMGDHTGENSVGRTIAGKLTDIKKLLVKQIADASPEYQSALDNYAKSISAIEDTESGTLGKLDQLTFDKVQNAATMLMGPQSGPKAVQAALADVAAVNLDAAQALKRTYLQGIFNNAMKETVNGDANVAGKFRQAVMGNPSESGRLQAALGPDEWKNLSDLSDVLQAASRVKPIGSDTAWNEVVKDAQREAARPIVAKIARNLNPAQALRSFDDWATGNATAGQAAQLADIVTSGDPATAATLRALKQMSPGSVRFRVLAGHLLAGGTTRAVAERVPAPAMDDQGQ